MSRRGWLLFGAMSVIWGVPYLLIKVAVEGVSAPVLVFARTAIGAAVLLPIAWRRGMLRPALAHWRPLLAFAVLEMGVPWFLLTDAEQHIGSGLAGLLIAAVPLVSTLVVWRLGDRSVLARGRLLGLLIGVAGVAAVMGLDLGSASPGRMAEVLLVAVGYAVAPIIASRKLSGVPTLAVVSLSLTGVCLAYIPAAALTWPGKMPSAAASGSILALGLVCTALAFLLFFALIAEVGPMRSTVITFVNPAVAVVLGTAVLGEPLTAGVGIGFPLVILGSWLSTRGGKTASDREGVGEAEAPAGQDAGELAGGPAGSAAEQPLRTAI